MKYLIVPTQDFQGAYEGKTPKVTDLPLFVQWFLMHYDGNVQVHLDESSWIKTNSAMAEKKKSNRSAKIKLLGKLAKVKGAYTGTFISKSPVNAFDQVEFLLPGFFSEGMFAFQERYCVLFNQRVNHGRRGFVRDVITPDKYHSVRRRLASAYKNGGKERLEITRYKISTDDGISAECLDHIIQHKDYTPFRNLEHLWHRIADFTIKRRRSDVFDISRDHYMYNPIHCPVEISASAKTIGAKLIDVGFTDDFALGKAGKLELIHRLQDLCNGHEPILADAGKRVVAHRKLPENPKLDMLMGKLEEIGDENQVVVFSYRTLALDDIEQALNDAGIAYVRYEGSDEQKAEAERKIESREARVMIANPSSAAFGLDCLRDINYTIWYCVGPSYETYYQALHRPLRGESTTAKFAYAIYVNNSVESKNWDALALGGDLTDADLTREELLFG